MSRSNEKLATQRQRDYIMDLKIKSKLKISLPHPLTKQKAEEIINLLLEEKKKYNL